MCRCVCNWPVYASHYVEVDCPQCGKLIKCDGLPPKPAAPPRPQDWPEWAKAIERLKRDTDIGVGDTVQRIAAWLGGERFKQFTAMFGIPCGCTQRQQEWNELYPYKAEE